MIGITRTAFCLRQATKTYKVATRCRLTKTLRNMGSSPQSQAKARTITHTATETTAAIWETSFTLPPNIPVLAIVDEREMNSRREIEFDHETLTTLFSHSPPQLLKQSRTG
ncbi:hypothetical protein PFISCL1PPCAC_7943 [Pristionchus fissidentatus]|uniref:Ribosomal protein n=1 Tax=Pristionchus fissidentatus TaxID=1538716 RepID=A0AAV5VB90_9BILA|nr:hypothetical protein PFISCL1PPCAC_7943 [Pristionchus fissidentatus]